MTDRPARNLVGGLIHSGRGAVSGLTVVTQEESTMAKADRTTKYTLNGVRFRINKGDIIPDGAVLDPEPEERAKPNAPENKAAKAAPENRAKGKDA